MKSRWMRDRGKIRVPAAVALLGFWLVTPAYGRGPDMHLCQLVSGEVVAEAVKGRIAEVRAAEGRCIYFVTLPEAKGKVTFVIYRHAAGDYEELRDAQEGEISKVDGLGDEAILAFEPEAKRYWLLAVKRGVAAIQVSGADKEQVRQVAATALAELGRR